MLGKEIKIDRFLIGSILLIAMIGVLMLFSVSAPISKQKFGHSYYYLKHQILFGFLPGLVLGFMVLNTKLEIIKKWSLYLFLGNLFLCLLVFIPQVGLSISGAKRWIKIGAISFQPAEFLKISLLIYLSAWLSNQSKKELKTLLSFFLILLPVSFILLIQPDMSTLILLVFSSISLYFLSKTPFWHTVLLILLSATGLFLSSSARSYRLARLLTFINPNIDPMGISYQVKQSLIAIGSGGVWGKGLGLSKQKFGLLPNPISDSIFSIFCEETGFIGPFILILLFLLFLIRVMMIGQDKDGQFSELPLVLAGGIVLQAFLNMAAMMGIAPLTGVPLPFISYGGTHLIAECIALGLILNIYEK